MPQCASFTFVTLPLTLQNFKYLLKLCIFVYPMLFIFPFPFSGFTYHGANANVDTRVKHTGVAPRQARTE